MTYQIFQLPKQSLIGGAAIKPSFKVNFFLTGTTTPTPVYTTSALSVAHTQPVQADSGGVLATVYLDPSIVYKASVYDQNDVLQYTVDPVNDAVVSQASIGAALYPRTDAEISAGVTPTSYVYPPGDVRRYGAVGDNSTDCTTAIQDALDVGSRVFIPNGTWKITASLDLPSYAAILFESRNAILKASIGSPLLRGKNGTTTRTYGANIYGGTLNNTSSGTAGGVGIDWKSMTMAKCYGTIIQNVETGIKNGGTDAQGAFYNEFHGVDISDVVTGIDNGTLGNDNKFFGGRVNSSTTGTRDNDCSGNLYCGVAVETFSTVGHLNSNSAAATNIKYAFSRIENSSGIGIDIRSAAQVCDYIFPQFTSVTTAISDASSTADTHGISDEGWVIRGGTPITKHQRVTGTLNFGSIAAGATAELAITITGATTADSIIVTPPSTLEAGLVCCGVPSTGQHYVRLANVTAGAIDPASATFTIDIWRH